MDNQVKLLTEVIATQSNSLPYSSSSLTTKHKLLCYQAFNNLLQQSPQKMVDYLLHGSRSGGFQHKVFQEYIRLLEASLPLMFQKGKQLYQVASLLDNNLSLFTGVSSFEMMVPVNGVIKNGTTEMYIGGRKSSIVRPYYIGKLLDVVDMCTKQSLMSRVQEYSFSVIKTDILSGTQVVVSHLRTPPHYQMGGMVYVNRVRAKIVEQAKSNNQGG